MDILGAMVTLVFFILFGVIWLLPLLFILLSERTGGKEKLAWILAVIFISWFAWVLWLLLAPIKPIDAYRRR
ncbi:MAG: hypothetical protein O3A63_07875 [Proteobacteria bacterium]|nr:hypothetical protein [Pseudomonadota bacterium]